MKRPAWAASPNFARAWVAMDNERSGPTGEPLLDEPHYALKDWMHTGLAEARPIFIPWEQVDAIPPTTPTEAATLFESGDILPFPWTFLDFGENTHLYHGVTGPANERVSARDYAVGGEGLGPCAALLGPTRWGFPGIMCFAKREGRVARSRGLHIAREGGWFPCDASSQSVRGRPGSAEGEARGPEIAAIARLVDVLAWMLSVNVEVVESPMKPIRRAREIQKGRQIALTVQVKQSKRRISKPSENRADFSHRFEVRGHYTHHFETKPDGTPNKVFERYARLHPEKVLTIQDQPCVRFWTPPYVKGPTDKPFVPKVRVVE